MVSTEGKGGTTSTHKDTKTCYYCGKPGHIALFCFKAKNNKENENANKAKDDDDYAFATKDGDHCKAICKWVMDSGATKHMTPHRAAFDMYEVIPSSCESSLSLALLALSLSLLFLALEQNRAMWPGLPQ